jgi:hypothetical protein
MDFSLWKEVLVEQPISLADPNMERLLQLLLSP